MKLFRFVSISFIAIFVTFLVTNNVSAETWEKTFGGSDSDAGYSIKATTDGGYIIVGLTQIYGEVDVDEIGLLDQLYLIKTDANGEEQWSKTHAGCGISEGYSIQQTTDGGYIIAGEAKNYPYSWSEAYLLKTDVSGNEQWSRSFGDSTYDKSSKAAVQTSDGGYIIAVRSNYAPQHSSINLIKTDANGVETGGGGFGGYGYFSAESLQKTTDGGYVLLATRYVPNAPPESYIWVEKYDASNNFVWRKTFGGSSFLLYGSSIQQTTDGGYIVAGKRDPQYGDSDVYLIKLDANGDEQWSKIFGDNDSDESGNSVIQDSDGGFVIAGETKPYGGINPDSHLDVYLIKTDFSGNKQWSKTFGGSNRDVAYSIQHSNDGGYIIAGETWSFGAGGSDVYLIYYGPKTQKAIPGIQLLLMDE